MIDVLAVTHGQISMNMVRVPTHGVVNIFGETQVRTLMKFHQSLGVDLEIPQYQIAERTVKVVEIQGSRDGRSDRSSDG